jgi:hypothetical protein
MGSGLEDFSYLFFSIRFNNKNGVMEQRVLDIYCLVLSWLVLKMWLRAIVFPIPGSVLT